MTLNEYQDFANSLWVNHKNPEMQIPHAVLGLVGETGEVAELFKKAIRGDGDGTVNKDKLTKELGDVLYYLVMLARLHEIVAEDIVTANEIKLSDRSRRGVLKGSGDER